MKSNTQSQKSIILSKNKHYMQQDFIHEYQRLLQQLKAEIDAFPNEESLWEIPPGVLNSAGTICYHLCGNLNHFIGKGMGNSGYVRDRPLEFSIRNVPKNDLLAWVDETSEMIAQTLPDVDLSTDFPKEYWGMEMTRGAALLKLLKHLSWHLGQINYLRRMMLGG